MSGERAELSWLLVSSTEEGQVCPEDLSIYVDFDKIVLFYNNHLATGFI